MMRENFATPFDRQPLFPGTACFPLSPGGAAKKEGSMPGSDEGEEDMNKGDQLSKIFEIIGTPTSPDDLNFIQQEKAVSYIKEFPKK
jgi:mitogen-activated protein kinase 1/3